MKQKFRHSGATAIRLSWFVLVFPAICLSYLGQGSKKARKKEEKRNNQQTNKHKGAALLQDAEVNGPTGIAWTNPFFFSVWEPVYW